MSDILKQLKKLPPAPGIYLYYNSKKELIYIGKATSLRSRVRSYFIGPKTDRPIETFISEVNDIKWIKTDSVLEAIILEANYIKKFQPKYNVLGKDDKSWNYLVITKDKYPRVKLMRENELKKFQIRVSNLEFRIFKVFGPYPGLKQIEFIKILRRLFNISTCTPNQGRPCFYYQLNQCLGVCTGEISSADYKKKVIRPLILFLSGKKKRLIQAIKTNMSLASKEKNFESAGHWRDQLFALNKIQDVALINKSFFNKLETLNSKSQISISNLEFRISRIEGYDISNLGSTGKVGSMVVFDSKEPIKSQYRKFKIKNVIGQSDVDCLKEIIERRLNHSEWPLPDIFLIDGGLPQINAVKNILSEKNINRTVVGIAKGPERKKNEFHITLREPITKEWIEENKNLLIQTRDEAHRFAITYQKQLRKIK